MSQFQINALAEKHFKAPVTFRLASDRIDNNGNTLYDTGHFIGVFKAGTVEQSLKQLDEIREAQDTNDTEALSNIIAKQTRDSFIGFEKHPKHPFPFLDGDTEVPSTQDNIAKLLNISEIRDAVQRAYRDARSAEVLTKNSRK